MHNAAATIESMASYARHAIVSPIVLHGFGNHDVAAIMVVLVLDDCGLLGLRNQFIPQTVDFCLHGECACRHRQ